MMRQRLLLAPSLLRPREQTPRPGNIVALHSDGFITPPKQDGLEGRNGPVDDQ
jgi:hypothetical protein